ncbi:uncharacterized protein [Lepisosteus oculatus]|uniref:uncharacterized protein n=1 Tax=Lepisosteus oculatus TaxID=7918 RepID=UPI0035F50061
MGLPPGFRPNCFNLLMHQTHFLAYCVLNKIGVSFSGISSSVWSKFYLYHTIQYIGTEFKLHHCIALVRRRTMAKITKTLSHQIMKIKRNGKSTRDIVQQLASMDIFVSESTVRWHYKGERRQRESKPRTIQSPIVRAIDKLTDENDELPAMQVQRRLWADLGATVSPTSIRRVRRRLGWRYRKTNTCPMIRLKNKEERLKQALQWIEQGEAFQDVLFTDETTVALEQFSTMAFCKKGRYVYKPKPKHPLKVHVWGGISRRGPGPLLIFEGIMDREFFEEVVVTQHAAPYIREQFGSRHRLFQYNNPKHTAARARLIAEGVNWVKTPAESPDLNPIEMVWHSLKDYVRKTAKPVTKQELIDGIYKFWEEELTEQNCNNFINRLFRVLPRIVDRGGGHSGM